jgi:CHAT domain-containing protein
MEEFQEAGYQVFHDLFYPLVDKMEKIQKLIIIPDEILHYLPFETLVTQKSMDRKNVHFLLENFPITYLSSASFLVELRRQKKASEVNYDFDLIALANPIIAAHGNQITQLLYPVEEIKAISKLFPENKKKLFFENEATELALKQVLTSPAKYLHFAAHCFIDENNMWSPEILLAKNEFSEDDGRLKISEIFNLKLNTDLVVLSGCSTGRGRFFLTEGIYNLTRAFFYAGAPSVIASLWEVNDYSTAILMKKFYQHLFAGQGKDEALRSAKIELLKFENGKFQNPYYWSPFVLIGDYQQTQIL